MKINGVVVVEGKTDSAKLQSYFDVVTIETNGSAISKKTLELIKLTKKNHPIVVFTDPDSAGRRIREIVSSYLENDCFHAFISKKDCYGNKKIGIAEASKNALYNALKNVIKFTPVSKPSISFDDYKKSNSAIYKNVRDGVSKKLGLDFCNSKTFYKRLNLLGINFKQLQQLEMQD